MLALVVAPAARRAWETARTGVAPGSRFALRAAFAGDDLVVVGAVLKGDTTTPAAWRWGPGGGWTERSDTTSADRLLSAVAVADGRAVAAGSVGGQAALLVRPLATKDGPWAVVWRHPADDPAVSGELTAVAVMGPTVVAAGTVRGAATSAAAVLHGTLGGELTLTTLADGGTATAVTTQGDALLVGGQTAPPDGRSGAAAVWRSDDGGTTWTADAVPAPPDARRAWISGLAATPERVVAVGMVDGGPAAWVLEGGAWTFAGALTPDDGPGRRVTAVGASADGRTFLAGGGQNGLGDVRTPLAWTSTDGRTWRAAGVGGDGVTEVVDVLTAPDGHLAALANGERRKRQQPVLLDLRGSVLEAADR